jgi:hypothetical protein
VRGSPRPGLYSRVRPPGAGLATFALRCKIFFLPSKFYFPKTGLFAENAKNLEIGDPVVTRQIARFAQNASVRPRSRSGVKSGFLKSHFFFCGAKHSPFRQNAV